MTNTVENTHGRDSGYLLVDFSIILIGQIAG